MALSSRLNGAVAVQIRIDDGGHGLYVEPATEEGVELRNVGEGISENIAVVQIERLHVGLLAQPVFNLLQVLFK
jgi:hypothetical protein